MSGKPAARQGDMTQYGGPIVQGSAGVRIGAPTGVACSVCPGGMTSGNPVNPLLGAKVLPGETDLALPGPLPFILSRTYSSYRTRTPAPVGVFGPGWKAPSDIRLQLRDDALVLNDNGGRSIHFEPLLPGEAVYSRSESMWLVRGGKAAQPDGHTLARLWGALPPDIRLSPHLYLATNSAQGLWWILGWSERVPGAEDVLPAPLPPYRVLTGLADRFGRTLTYRREAAGDLAGEITGVTDGAGREFRLVLTTQAQRAEEARTSSLSSSDSSRPLSASPFPDTLPGTEYGPDRGIRLSAVWLMHDPAYPESLPGAPLARYTYTEAGELLAVYDRSNTQVRAFTYDAQHPGRMVAHRYAGRPEMRYRYDDTRIVLTGHPQANLNREWQVVASELHGEQPQAVPGRQGAGTALENHFAVIPADRTWRPQPLLKPLVDGPQSAVVTGPAGEEIFCDEHGRVRVKFNWDRYNPADQDSSCWIRVAQAWAGTGFGHLAIPRVGQEVIVDFLNGDPDQPIIMGRTYHQENRTPGSLPGTKTQMTIRSKTYMGSGFNELKFDDATGREQVYIHAQKNMDTEVLNDRTTTVKHDHRETVKNDQTVTIQEGNRLLTVEKGHKITGVLKGSLSEDVFQDRGTIAGSVHVDAVNNGGEGDGIQAYTAIKEILLAVEESKIALTPDGIQLQVGESTVIRLSKDGITIVGGSVFIN
ncbi:type VI secretion system tip protein TssI/VgrG [Escherichia coli]|uniref:type VI secretion system tip protein TssI/VgrG n=1 Tax=Escherichia coli TaxID=562 RepID=UPI0006A08B70|nr:type VI secretion system tip protein TssI/VgrG [Escherichia coli]CTT21254.1 Core protein [Escherichia coli]